MSNLSDEDIADLTKSTQKDLGWLKFGQIAQRRQHYEAFDRLFRKDRVQVDGSTGIKRTLMLDHSGAAKHVGLHATDNVNIGDVLATMEETWAHTQTYYGWERREVLENIGKGKIVDLMDVRRTDGMLSLIELIEDAFWDKPATSADKITPKGVPYWIVWNATEGFNGGDPAGFAAGAGGITTASQRRWKNYSGAYVAITRSDLIRKMKKSYRQTRFMSPISVPDFRRGKGDQYRHYMNDTSIGAFEEAIEEQNDNLGTTEVAPVGSRDVSSMDGVPTFRRNPMIWVPKLDEDASDPIYSINWSTFGIYFLKGDYLRESDPALVANQHNDWVVFIDLTWQPVCVDRRRNSVFAKSAPGTYVAAA